MKKNVLLLIFLFALNGIYAQKIDIVSLTTIGEGKTKDEAVTNALRSAIEQSFGTFISSQTNIVNDELVKDEIVSVSNGNIKKYDIVDSQSLSNGNTSVTVKSQVSLYTLSSFCKNKGFETEFDGAAFGANIKLQELYAKNEIEAIRQLQIPFLALTDRAFDYKVSAKDPIKAGTYKVTSRNQPIETGPRRQPKTDEWEVPLEITASANQNFFSATEVLFNTLSSLSLSKSEVENYLKINKTVYPFTLCISSKKYDIFYLRSQQSVQQILSLLSSLRNSLMKAEIDANIQTVVISSLPNALDSKNATLINKYGTRNAKNANPFVCQLDNIYLSEVALYSSQMVQSTSLGYSARRVTSKTYENTPFDFLYKLEKNALIHKAGNRGVDFGSVISLSAINKDKYNLLVFNTVHPDLSTDKLSKIKKYTISSK
ncbi:LPP20 family lipoprotein [Dysgonomonas sp. 511]|uniref:LPP20 family lipoprotein n=1 Tax=Dysgonomonas sp. 511 TaxID=2302930 RepID=UPI0013D11B62|nr:LPP20 family lipoprotein [Dysgonomonas sp. 511]NDV78749.1 hypothetical protein [Dysgonomonas sp. 511]